MTDFSADLGPTARAFSALISSAPFAAVGDPLRTTILDNAPSVGATMVPKFVGLAEIIFAARATLPPEVLRFGAQAAFLCRSNGWSRMDQGRGWAIQQALQRDAGDDPPEGSTWPDPSTDPAAQLV